MPAAMNAAAAASIVVAIFQYGSATITSIAEVFVGQFNGAATPAIAALTGFFVGIGKTRYILAITVVVNLLNIILDPLLIFGVKGWLAPTGSKGAAIATGIFFAVSVFSFCWGLFKS